MGILKYGVLRTLELSVYPTFFEVDAFLFLDLANCFYHFGFFSFSFGHLIVTSWALLIFLLRRSRDCSFAWVC